MRNRLLLLGLLAGALLLLPDYSQAQTAVAPCKATAAAPSYTEGKPAPCSVDLNGNLRTNSTLTGTFPLAIDLSPNNIAYPTTTIVGAVLLCDDGAALDKCQAGLTDTDDGSIAFSQVPNLIISENYMSSGTDWIRMVGTALRGLTVNQSASVTYTATNLFTPPATPTDLVTITGSATKTVKVWSVRLVTTNTAAGSQEFFLIKRSTADTGGTPVAGTVFPLDSASAAATATINHYTANPGALGTVVGTANRVRIASPAAVPASFAGVVTDAGYELLPLMRNGTQVQPVTLRGIAEQLAVNFNGAALVAGQTHVYTVVLSEE